MKGKYLVTILAERYVFIAKSKVVKNPSAVNQAMHGT